MLAVLRADFFALASSAVSLDVSVLLGGPEPAGRVHTGDDDNGEKEEETKVSREGS